MPGYVSTIALRHCHHYNRTAAIVNTAALTPLGLTQEALAQNIMDHKMLANWHILTAAQILGSPIKLPKATTGLLVTGYSSQFLDQRRLKDEDSLQAKIRCEFGNHFELPFSLLVLSQTLPNTNFKEAKWPWYNGPFQSDPTWSIEPMRKKTDEVTGFALTRHHLGKDDRWENTWSILNRFEFPLRETESLID